MQASVVSVTAANVTLRAPLEPNINHRETVFGGSAAALAVLAAWSLVHTRLADASLPCRLVIQRNSMEYFLPMHGEFTARSSVSDERWDRFLRTLRRKGTARIAVSCDVESAERPSGRFEGEFVALRG